MLIEQFPTLAQECLSFLYRGLMRPKENACADGGLHQANYQNDLPFYFSLLATRREIFSYAHVVADAIPKLPAYLKASTIRHLLQVLHAGLTGALQ